MRKNCAESCNSCEELDGSDNHRDDDVNSRDNEVDSRNDVEVEIHVNDGQATTRAPRQEFEDDEDGLGFICYFVQFILSYIYLFIANSDPLIQMHDLYNSDNKIWDY